MPPAVVLDGQSLTLDDVVAVAVRRAPVELAPAARTRMEQANAVVAALVESGAVAYGVTTGFGKLSEIAIPPARLGELQVNLVRSHAAGVGPPLPERGSGRGRKAAVRAWTPLATAWKPAAPA